MTKAKRHILPFFIPHLGCPHQCIFCNQFYISGQRQKPSAEEVAAAIVAYQKINPGVKPELAFYGGSFTALLPAEQRYYLQPALDGLKAGFLAGIRVSTRPDCIDVRTIQRLKRFQVQTVELGVQSMCDDVLRIAERGHTAEDSKQALQLLKQYDMKVGVQLMSGLPGESEESFWLGSQRILMLHPDFVRIYPTVVLRNTKLAEYYQAGSYQPYSLQKAVEITANLNLLCQYWQIPVIRMGLQAEEGLTEQILAGPYHPAFGHLVQSNIWCRKVKQVIGMLSTPADFLAILVNRRDIAKVVGQNRCNIPYYEHLLQSGQRKFQIKGWELPPETVGVMTKDGNIFYLEEKDFLQKTVKKLLSMSL